LYPESISQSYPVKWFCIPIMYPRDIPNIFGSFFYSIPLYIPTKESIYKTNRNVFWSNHHFSLYIKPPVLCLNRPMFDQCQSPVISRQRPNQRQGPEGSPRPMTGMQGTIAVFKIPSYLRRNQSLHRKS
jgi:hypothetical protein